MQLPPFSPVAWESNPDKVHPPKLGQLYHHHTSFVIMLEGMQCKPVSELSTSKKQQGTRNDQKEIENIPIFTVSDFANQCANPTAIVVHYEEKYQRRTAIAAKRQARSRWVECAARNLQLWTGLRFVAKRGFDWKMKFPALPLLLLVSFTWITSGYPSSLSLSILIGTDWMKWANSMEDLQYCNWN